MNNELAVAVLSANSLELPAGLPYEQWLAIVKDLFAHHTKWQWAIGDALVYGQNNYHPDGSLDSYRKIAAATGKTVAYLYDIASVSRSITISDRSEVLSWTHHRAVAKLIPERQKYWLNLAVALKFTVSELKYEMYAYEPAFRKDIQSSAGVERPLLPPVPPEPEEPGSEPPKPEPKPKLSKSLELTTHLTGIEEDVLKQFAREKKITAAEAIRAFVVIGLHSSGDLQRFVDTLHEGYTNKCEAEIFYLRSLGKGLFGDAEKFQLNLPDEEALHHNDHPGDRLGVPDSKIKGSIESVVRMLGQIPDLSADDVCSNLSAGLGIQQAEFILAEAKKIIAATPEAPAVVTSQPKAQVGIYIPPQPDPLTEPTSEPKPVSTAAFDARTRFSVVAYTGTGD